MKSAAVIVMSVVLLAALSLSCTTPSPVEESTKVSEPAPPGSVFPTTEPSSTEEWSPSPQDPDRIQARVVAINDGDTIEVEIDGQVRKVRYLGIDCPETDCEMGIAATEFNRALVEGEMVELVKDISETDEHDRLLRYVYVGGVLVNAELVEQGYARAVVLSPDLAHTDEFLLLEQEARLAGRGIWGVEDSPVPVSPTPGLLTSTPASPASTPVPLTPT